MRGAFVSSWSSHIGNTGPAPVHLDRTTRGQSGRPVITDTRRQTRIYQTLTYIRMGLSSCDNGVSWLLPRLVGLGRAHEMMLTGRFRAAPD
jgi:hypothetical protein